MSGIKNESRPIMKVKFDDDGKHATIIDTNERIGIYHDPRDLIGKKIGHIIIDDIAGVRDKTDGISNMFYYKCHCIAEDNGIVCNKKILFPRSFLQTHKNNNNLSCGCIDYKKYETDIINSGRVFDGVKPIKYIGWEYNKSRLNHGRHERIYYYKCKCIKHGLEYILSRQYLFYHHKYCPCIMDAYKTTTISFKNSFRAMHDRCYNEKHDAYLNYGGRGIKVCDRWYKDLYFFKLDMYDSYWQKVNECGGDEFEVSIDRIDVNGDYTPENTKWSTYEEQNRNRRNTVYYYFNGNRYIFHELLQFCDKTLLESTFRERLYRNSNMCANNVILTADIFKDFKYRELQQSKGIRFPVNYTTNIEKINISDLPATFNFMNKEEACKK